ncbi:MAG TPA: S41 family peptidase [Chitinophagaceae bacterium]|nr:S41 family peptidase [Chitinophagaceae bacterium]
MVSKKLQVWLPLLFSVVMILGMYLGFTLRGNVAGAGVFLKNNGNSSVDEVLNLIKTRYVDNVKTDSLTDYAIDNILSHLDPHSVYIPAKELAYVNEDLEGKFQGIGVEFQVFNDTVNILSVLPGGPSEKAGVQVGDKIIKVNDSVKIAGVHITGDAIRGYLRGPQSSTVSITVLRKNTLKKIVIERGMIPLPSVDAAYMIAPQTGFIRINKFAATTYFEFMDAITKLQKEGMQKLILDLRDNGGGLVDQATDIADEFLDDDKMIVYTEGSKSPRTDYRCKKEGVFEKGKLIVLVNESTASASEILSGALQDWDRATIVGRRTFGKGLVQNQFNLSDNGALRLTIARYYTPLGRNIQKPYDKGREQYEDELMNRFHDGEVVHGDTTKHSGPVYKTPGGHIVYGGGGITPDVFVPFDTVMQSRAIGQMYIKSTLSDYIYNYYMQHEDALQQIKTPEELYKQFVPGASDWEQLVAFARRDSIDISGVSPLIKADIMKRLPPMLARQMWRTEGYFEVNNETDSVVRKALELVK